MVQRGLGRSTMREIADRAGVNPALLHYYFGTKTGLFTAIIERVHEQLRDQLDRAARQKGSVRDRLRALLRTYAVVIASEPYIARLIIEELLDRPSSEAQLTHGIGDLLAVHVRTLFEDGVASGELRNPKLPFPFLDIVPQIVFFMLMSPLSRGTVPAVEHLAPWAKEAAEILLSGLEIRETPL